MSKITINSSIYLRSAWVGLEKMANQVGADYYAVAVEFAASKGKHPNGTLRLYMNNNIGWTVCCKTVEEALEAMKSLILDKTGEEVEYKERMTLTNGS